MATESEARSLLKQALDNRAADFRGGQWEAVDALVNRRRRLLVVQRTGWGKSYVYFIATRLLRNQKRGPTLIVSPLLALMRNQIVAAERLNLRAATINSTNREDWNEVRKGLDKNAVDVLLISPERLANESFIEEILMPMAGRIGLLVVDEAHCISDWGHDFRPDYRRIANVLESMPANLPILGTTATANNRVIEDVRNQLGDIDIQRGALRRRSLELQNIRMPSLAERLSWLAERVTSLPGTGIIYTLTTRDADRVANWLGRNRISAAAYHAGKPDDERRQLEDQLLGNRIKALVATTALGMGYDKPDLGFVVHFQAPGSIVGYYQQVGRAGRAVDRAVGIVLSGDEDAQIHSYFRRTAFPDETWVEAILTALAGSDGLGIRDMESVLNLRNGQIDKALKFLSVESPAPAIKIDGKWRRTAIEYRIDRDRISRLTNQRVDEWNEVQQYIDHRGCLMAFLSTALDDPDPQPCGKCAQCLGRPVVSPNIDRGAVPRASRFLDQSEFELKCKTQAAKGAFTEYAVQSSIPPNERAEVGRILSRWGDPGWGQMVAEDKSNGHFRDDLVAAAEEMLVGRWKPMPAPDWVTCIPSSRRPELVPDFAARLARALGLPFVTAVVKAKHNQQQKAQQNRYFQCRNLDGAFAVQEPLPAGPVLLIDDIVDSAWTMTVVSMLLRRARSGLVWPMALASVSLAN